MKKYVVFLLLSGLVLPGCAAFEAGGNGELSTGIGHVYETRPAYTYTFVLHFEDRPEPSAIAKFIGVFENISGWPQTVASIATGPNRVIDATVGGSREEVLITVGAEKPQDFKAMMDSVAQAIEKANIDATVMGYENPTS